MKREGYNDWGNSVLRQKSENIFDCLIWKRLMNSIELYALVQEYQWFYLV